MASRGGTERGTSGAGGSPKVAHAPVVRTGARAGRRPSSPESAGGEQGTRANRFAAYPATDRVERCGDHSGHFPAHLAGSSGAAALAVANRTALQTLEAAWLTGCVAHLKPESGSVRTLRQADRFAHPTLA